MVRDAPAPSKVTDVFTVKNRPELVALPAAITWMYAGLWPLFATVRVHDSAPLFLLRLTL